MSAPAPLPHLGLILGGAPTLTAESGTYSLTGQDAGLAIPGDGSPAPFPHLGLLGGLGGEARRLVAESGTYSLTGQDAQGLRAYLLTAERGTYATQGQVGILEFSNARAGDPAPLPHLGLLLAPNTGARTLTCDTGIYSVNGSEVLLDHELDADQGAYTLAGQDATLRADRRLVAESGSYSLAGTDALFSRSGTALSMAAATGYYETTGQDAQTLVGTRIGAEHGFYSVSGQAATTVVGLAPSYHLTAESGAYSLTGIDTRTYYGGAVLFAEYGVYSLRGFPEVVTTPGGGYDYKKKRTTRTLKDRREEEEEEFRQLLEMVKEAAQGEAEKAAETPKPKAYRPKAPDLPVQQFIEPQKVQQELTEAFQRAYKAALPAAIQQVEDDEDAEVLLMYL